MRDGVVDRAITQQNLLEARGQHVVLENETDDRSEHLEGCIGTNTVNSTRGPPTEFFPNSMSYRTRSPLFEAFGILPDQKFLPRSFVTSEDTHSTSDTAEFC